VTTLADRSDVLLLDLDGTVYLGGQVIPHVADVLPEAARRGARPMFVTNNASRPPAEVAAALNDMGVAAVAADVLTSPEAAATMLAQTHPVGSRVLVVGAKALSDAVAAVGLEPVRLAADEPVAVVQGHSPDTGWRDLAEACIALRAGVDWVASNTDTTLPTDRGLLPGNGAMVQALMVATGRTPRVAGKPNRPLLDEAVRRVGASKPLVVGDRLDTDIEAAVLASMPSLLVLTGVSTAADLLTAPASRRPTHVAFDLRGLIDETMVATVPADVGPDSAADGRLPSPWTVEPGAKELVLTRTGVPVTGGDDDGTMLAALARLAAVAWETGINLVRGGDASAVAALTRFGLVDTGAPDPVGGRV
jgi:glycerol 3-phosphatase-2